MTNQAMQGMICPSCGNPGTNGGLFCVHCGVSLSSAVDARTMYRGGQLAPAAGNGAGPQAWSPMQAGVPQGWQHSSAQMETASNVELNADQSSSHRYGLSQAFGHLVPASAGRRIGSFSIDVAACIAVAVLVFLGTKSQLLAALGGIELMVGLVCWEARRGTTLGQKLLGVWTTTTDGPNTPGILKSVIRGGITSLGALGAGVGAWVVVASSAWDPARAGQGWQDRVARTRIVFEPNRREARRRASMSVVEDRRPAVGSPLSPGLTYHPPQVTDTTVKKAGAPPVEVMAQSKPASQELPSAALLGIPGPSLTPRPQMPAPNAPIAPPAGQTPVPAVSMLRQEMPQEIDQTRRAPGRSRPQAEPNHAPPMTPAPIAAAPVASPQATAPPVMPPPVTTPPAMPPQVTSQPVIATPPVRVPPMVSPSRVQTAPPVSPEPRVEPLRAVSDSSSIVDPPIDMTRRAHHRPASSVTPEQVQSQLMPTTFPQSSGRGPQPTSAGAPAAGRVLTLTFDTGQQLRIASGQDGVMGRAPSVPAGLSAQAQTFAIQDPDMSISKTHLSFVAQGTVMWITDLNSTNGTAILAADGTGRLLVAGQREQAALGDRVQLGRRVFTIA